jgi:hypothetical protein
VKKTINQKLSVPYHKTKRNEDGIIEDENALTTEEFISIIAPTAQELEKQTGIFASLTLAQAIQETGRGNSRVGREAGNVFGVKATKQHKDLIYTAPNKKSYIYFMNYPKVKKIKNLAERIKAAWKESIMQRKDLFKNVQIYQLVKLALLPETAAFLLQYPITSKSPDQSGYAEDNLYPKNLIFHIETHNLRKYDIDKIDYDIKKYPFLDSRTYYIIPGAPYYPNEIIKQGFKPNDFQKKYYIIPCNRNGVYKKASASGYESVLFLDTKHSTFFTSIRKIQTKYRSEINSWNYLTNPTLK